MFHAVWKVPKRRDSKKGGKRLLYCFEPKGYLRKSEKVKSAGSGQLNVEVKGEGAQEESQVCVLYTGTRESWSRGKTQKRQEKEEEGGLG